MRHDGQVDVTLSYVSPSDPAPTFDSLLREIVTAAGGLPALAAKADVKPSTLRKWRNGNHPIDRLSEPVERVDAWARRNMSGTYPPAAWPRGLPGFIGAPPESNGLEAQPGTELDRSDAQAEPELVAQPVPADAQTEPGLVESAPTPEPTPVPDVKNTPTPTTPKRLRWPTGRRRLLAIVGALLIVTVGGVWLLRSAPSAPPQPSTTAAVSGGRTVVVQNEVAFGPSSLAEDRSPAYLSSRPVARCANIGCKLDGTDVATGDTLQAVCQLQGQLMTNANVASPGIKANPNVAGSALWYSVIWRDGRRGYFSEVYVGPTYRGGLGLPPC